MLTDKLGAESVVPGARCQNKRRDAHCCGAPLGSRAKHADRCHHGGGGYRVHRAFQQAYARWLREAGANVDLERFVADFTTPSEPEAYLDVVAHWPASPLLFAVDVTIRDPGAKRYSGSRDCAGVGEAEKKRRYGAGVIPLAMWSGGRVGEHSLKGMRAMAAEATRAKLQDEPRNTLLAKWRVELEAALLWARADLQLRATGRGLIRPTQRTQKAVQAQAALQPALAQAQGVQALQDQPRPQPGATAAAPAAAAAEECEAGPSEADEGDHLLQEACDAEAAAAAAAHEQEACEAPDWSQTE